ncbi:MAG: hypothetical protein IPG50_04425 [Myxococcales bacterium]|nr:hypothetical protein [Myxococcales bacterium]
MRRTSSSDGCSLVAAADRALLPNVLSVKHWDRLLRGALYAATVRIDWATLLRNRLFPPARLTPR